MTLGLSLLLLFFAVLRLASLRWRIDRVTIMAVICSVFGLWAVGVVAAPSEAWPVGNAASADLTFIESCGRSVSEIGHRDDRGVVGLVTSKKGHLGGRHYVLVSVGHEDQVLEGNRACRVEDGGDDRYCGTIERVGKRESLVRLDQGVMSRKIRLCETWVVASIPQQPVAEIQVRNSARLYVEPQWISTTATPYTVGMPYYQAPRGSGEAARLWRSSAAQQSTVQGFGTEIGLRSSSFGIGFGLRYSQL